jgi:hypothetical protein
VEQNLLNLVRKLAREKNESSRINGFIEKSMQHDHVNKCLHSIAKTFPKIKIYLFPQHHTPQLLLLHLTSYAIIVAPLDTMPINVQS